MQETGEPEAGLHSEWKHVFDPWEDFLAQVERGCPKVRRCALTLWLGCGHLPPAAIVSLLHHLAMACLPGPRPPPRGYWQLSPRARRFVDRKVGEIRARRLLEFLGVSDSSPDAGPSPEVQRALQNVPRLRRKKPMAAMRDLHIRAAARILNTGNASGRGKSKMTKAAVLDWLRGLAEHMGVTGQNGRPLSREAVRCILRRRRRLR